LEAAKNEKLVAELQWGHHFAVDHFVFPVRLSADELQWGHHFAVVDTGAQSRSRIPPAGASMGPPLCSGGYVVMSRYIPCP